MTEQERELVEQALECLQCWYWPEWNEPRVVRVRMLLRRALQLDAAAVAKCKAVADVLRVGHEFADDVLEEALGLEVK